MIDFNNSSFLKLKMVNPAEGVNMISQLLNFSDNILHYVILFVNDKII